MRYEAYKPTGTAWISTIPDQWDCKKIATLFSQRKTKVSDKDYPPLSVAKIGVVPQLDTAVKTDAGDNRKLVMIGDFVINSRSDRKGSCGVSPLNGSVSLINIVLTPRQEWNGSFVHYLLRSQPFSEEYYRYGRGIVSDLWTTRYSEMKSILLPIPPRKEQDHIVCYLDWQVSKTNKLIVALKKQIALLKEQKQAIINEAVTKGLNPDATMKDSGVTWIGEVPEHWDIVQLRRLVNSVKTGGTPQGATEDCFDNDGYNWYTPSDFSDDIYLQKAARCLSTKGKAMVNCFPAETVMMIGIGGTMGKVSISRDESSCNQQINAIVCNSQLDNRFLLYFLRAIREHLYKTAKYTTLPIFNQTETKSLLIPSLPVDEQREIVMFLNLQCAKFDSLILNINKEIKTLTEYRTRLIADVVTGQVDVRGVEVPDFEYVADEADEASDEDENSDVEETEDE